MTLAPSQQGTVEAPITISAIIAAPIRTPAAIDTPIIKAGESQGSGSGGTGKGDPVQPDT